MNFLVISISGFLALFLIVIALTLPYVLRRQMRSAGAHGSVIWQRIWVHSWIGYAILGLTIAHMYISMGAGMARFANALGLNIATLGLLLILGQVVIGLNLNGAEANSRRLLRRLHFMVMLGICCTVFLHLTLNSVLVHQLLGSK